MVFNTEINEFLVDNILFVFSPIDIILFSSAEERNNEKKKVIPEKKKSFRHKRIYNILRQSTDREKIRVGGEFH